VVRRGLDDGLLWRDLAGRLAASPPFEVRHHYAP
jgi:hypothetical protein